MFGTVSIQEWVQGVGFRTWVGSRTGTEQPGRSGGRGRVLIGAGHPYTKGQEQAGHTEQFQAVSGLAHASTFDVDVTVHGVAGDGPGRAFGETDAESEQVVVHLGLSRDRYGRALLQKGKAQQCVQAFGCVHFHKNDVVGPGGEDPVDDFVGQVFADQARVQVTGAVEVSGTGGAQTQGEQGGTDQRVDPAGAGVPGVFGRCCGDDAFGGGLGPAFFEHGTQFGKKRCGVRCGQGRGDGKEQPFVGEGDTDAVVGGVHERTRASVPGDEGVLPVLDRSDGVDDPGRCAVWTCVGHVRVSLRWGALPENSWSPPRSVDI